MSGKDKREAEARAREAALQLMDAADEIGDIKLLELCENVRDRLEFLARWETRLKELTEGNEYESKQVCNSA